MSNSKAVHLFFSNFTNLEFLSILFIFDTTSGDERV